MIERIVALIVGEQRWLTASLGLALAAVMALVYRTRGTPRPPRRRVLAAMNLFFGVTIGAMAFGHLLAVSTKLAMGTLEGSVPLLYAIGIALAVPSWWLVGHTRTVLASDDHGSRTVALNAWLGLTLLALGLPNVPLALPAMFNIGYHVHRRRAVGLAIVGTAAAVMVALFIGSLVFLASGQSFEQFSRMR